MEVEILGEQVVLYPQKAMFWKKQNVLFLADLHLGKINHFRKSGIPVPVKANDRNLEVLMDIINLTKPQRVICLGDLFHSHYNSEWEVFGELVNHYAAISFELVVGNHDIMSDHQYERKGIKLHDKLFMGPFLFTHHPLEEFSDTAYNIAGHIHPGIHLKGKGRQSVTLPCFYFGAKQAYLPAFGLFTGLALINPRKNDKVFVVADNKILSV
ncbi:ligase-associated DNA damage response endonuclease PdeM [Chryseosolibacter indicus]|uniref:Ligase-associated DNA damage response endonuclease PdeM n=1 Tax=Chryseosolibacter indicus TaxID=2782351 RepID=A0ABS5VTH8_9BACT|nr:ligase-associated DNA damage response endonuclease PdeM [Chryseosolibacter indicus]MBT1704728.1 ligase-associated DNA damage response endonuclease PdeM [Chryseosolibacter indicus]